MNEKRCVVPKCNNSVVSGRICEYHKDKLTADSKKTFGLVAVGLIAILGRKNFKK